MSDSSQFDCRGRYSVLIFVMAKALFFQSVTEVCGLPPFSTSSAFSISHVYTGAQWLSGRVLDWRPRGRVFEPYRRHCVVSLSKNINPSLVLVKPRKTHPFITERLLMGRKESNQTKHVHTCSMLQFALFSFLAKILHSFWYSDSSLDVNFMGCICIANFYLSEV